MSKLSPALVVILALAVGGWCGWQINGNLWSEKYVQLQKDHSDAIGKADRAAREKEHSLQAEADEEARQLRLELSSLVVERDSLDDVAERLRAENTRIRERASSQASSASGGSAPALSALILYSELLERESERANRLAGFADESRVRGLGCEAIYDRAREELANATK